MTAGGVRKRSSLQSLTEACHDTVRPHNRPMLIRLINGKCQNLVCLQSQNRLPRGLTEKDNVLSLKLTTFAKAKHPNRYLSDCFTLSLTFHRFRGLSCGVNRSEHQMLEKKLAGYSYTFAIFCVRPLFQV